jgi:hypothetical protein
VVLLGFGWDLLGRPRRTFQDNIKIDWDNQKSVVNTAVNLRLP